MSNINQLVYEASENFNKENAELKQYLKDPDVQEFVTYTARQELGEPLSELELKRYLALHEDPKVQAYIKTAEYVAQRRGWIKGGIWGGVMGGLTGGIVGVANSHEAGVGVATGIIGAILGAASVGFLGSKIGKILGRWKAEGKIAEQVPAGMRMHI